MFYILSTPIGNLEDLSFRAVRILSECDYILCEDTRHSRILLEHYKIDKPLISFHKFNEAAREDQIIRDLKLNKNVVLISDAGTPAIADPGARLIQRCINENIPSTAIPGASAVLTALILSGLTTERFQFCGFIPKKKNERLDFFKILSNYPGTSICYESPRRLQNTLNDLAESMPSHRGAVAKELTKKFETIFRGSFKEISKEWSESSQKGEIVVLIEGISTNFIEEFSLDEELDLLLTLDFEDQKGALKILAEKSGLPKRDLYKKLLEKKTT